MEIPPDLKFGLAIALLGVVMLSIGPQAALWLGLLLVLAALTYAEKTGSKSGHSFVTDLLNVFGMTGGKP